MLIKNSFRLFFHDIINFRFIRTETAIKILQAEDEQDSSSLLVEIVAHENISKYDLITQTGFKASCTNIAHWNKVAAIALENIANNTSGICLAPVGTVTNLTWSWTAGDNLFVGTNGQMVTAIPLGAVFVQKAGLAISPVDVIFDLHQTVLI